MFKKTTSAVLGTLGAIALLAGCSSSPAANDSSESAPAGDAAIAAPAGLNGKLGVCMDVSFPPMEYYVGDDTNNPQGVDVDLSHAIAETLGVEAELKPTGFDGLLPALSAGRCDAVISGILITEERTKQVPAVGYLDTHRVIMVSAGNPKGISSIDDLSGKNVALEGGTNYEEIVNGWNDDFKAAGKPEINIQLYPKQTDAVQQLLVGRADAVVTQDTEAAFRATEDPDAFEVAHVLSDQATFGVYYNDAIEGLGDALEEAIALLKENGEIDAIADAHNLKTEVQ